LRVDFGSRGGQLLPLVSTWLCGAGLCVYLYYVFDFDCILRYTNKNGYEEGFRFVLCPDRVDGYFVVDCIGVVLNFVAREGRV
jgi:hypothetical protein